MTQRLFTFTVEAMNYDNARLMAHRQLRELGERPLSFELDGIEQGARVNGIVHKYTVRMRRMSLAALRRAGR